MKKDYLHLWGYGENLKKLTRAMFMMKDTALPDVATFTGVPEKVIIQACMDFGFEEYLVDEEKARLNAAAFYDDLIPEVDPSETREERLLRVREAISSFQNNCPHEKIICRCSRCMKVLGGEIHYVKYDRVENAVKKTTDELWSIQDHTLNERLELYQKTFLRNLYEHETDKVIS